MANAPTPREVLDKVRNEARYDRWLSGTHRHVECTVGHRTGVGWPVDKYLAALCPSLQRALFRRWVRSGWVQVNGRPATLEDVAETGMKLSVAAPLPEPDPEAQTTPDHPDVIHEEATFMAINKPPGQLSHPAGTVLSGTLLNQAQIILQRRGANPRDARLVNRIDRETSGLVLVGLEATTQAKLCADLQEHKFTKEYVAICHGIPAESSGSWTDSIGRSSGNTIAREIRDDGQHAHTDWDLAEKLGDNYCLLRLRLRTGRQHQIRIHAAHNGHPLVGDWVYGTPCAELPGQALHAARLVLPHPASGEPLELMAPLPPALADLARRLRDGKDPGKRDMTFEEKSRLGLTQATVGRRGWYEGIDEED